MMAATPVWRWGTHLRVLSRVLDIKRNHDSDYDGPVADEAADLGSAGQRYCVDALKDCDSQSLCT